MERLRPGRHVRKRLEDCCRLTLRLAVEGRAAPSVVLLAVEAKRTQSVSAAALRSFLNHDVAVRAEPGHDAVLTAFVSWLCDVPKAADYEGPGRLLFGAASEQVEATAAVLLHEVEALARTAAAQGSGERDLERLQARRADYLRDRLEAVLAQRSSLAEEEALLRDLMDAASAAAVDRGHRAGAEKRPPRAASSGPPWWKKPRVL